MNNFIYIDFITINETDIKIELNTENNVLIRAVINNKDIFYPQEQFKRADVKENKYEYVFVLHKKIEGDICFEIKVAEQWLLCDTLSYGCFCPIGTESKCGFYCKNGISIQAKSHSIKVQKITKAQLFKKNMEFLIELLVASNISRKALFVRLFARLFKLFTSKKIYIIHDRYDKADDNGEVFWSWLCIHKKNEIKAYFVLDKENKDYRRLKKISNRILQRDSIWYRIILMSSYALIESAGYSDKKNYTNYYRDICADIKYVFLQHGVTYNNVSAFMGRYQQGFDLITVVSQMEKNFICNQPGFYYVKDQVALTGFARFDRLVSMAEKVITILPTWRVYLKNKRVEELKDSEYVKAWMAVITNEKLHQELKKRGYRLRIKLHPSMQECVNVFKGKDVELLSVESPYYEIYRNSELIITDYSSAVFDFLYLNKPVLYYQFDYEQFYSGKHTTRQGYIDNKNNGFGPVTYTEKELVNLIIEYINAKCKMKDIYKSRVDTFFAFRDQNNCQRIYDELKNV